MYLLFLTMIYTRNIRLVPFLPLLFLAGCMEMQYSDSKLSREFPGVKARTYKVGGGTLYAVEGGNPLGLPVVWVHGSPGTWTGWSDFFRDTSLLRSYRMIAVDRPGFGFAEDWGAVPGLAEQAALLNRLLDSIGVGESVVLIGHSMGGPVAARMAMQMPERYKGLVLAAPALDPSLEEVTWYQRLAAKPFVERWLPKMIQHSTHEMISLKAELAAMLPLWSRIKARVIVIQGAKDKLVHPGNARFASKVVPSNMVTVWWDDELGHLIPWDRPELFVNAIQTLQ
jgi:pimeloyl-ACP methyl ester carboxylesterase